MPPDPPASQIRLARANEARRVAETHVAARRSAYDGLIPTEQLAAERVDDREARWQKRLADAQGRCWLLTEGSGLVGFAYTAPAGDDGLDADAAELYALYLLPQGIGRGLGRTLHDHALADLRRRGFREVVLWYAEENVRAGRFYAAAGFVPDPRTAAVPYGETGLTRRRLRLALG